MENDSVKFKNLFISDHRGSTLLMAVLILSGILIVSLGTANLVFSGVRLSRLQENSTRAYFSAEAGIERFIWAYGKNGFDISACSSSQPYVDFTSNKCEAIKPVYTLSNGASYYIIFSNASPLSFSAIGTFLNNNRSIEISY